MLLIELTYKKSLDEANKFFDQHRSFLNKYYAKRNFFSVRPEKSS